MKKHVFLLLSFVAIIVQLKAQATFSPSILTTIPGLTGGDTEFADFDNDGDLDVVLIGNGEWGVIMSQIYVNDGTGSFSLSASDSLESAWLGDVDVVDVDGDNDLDILIVGINDNDDGVANLYINNGGLFSLNSTTPFIGVQYSEAAFADVDGDNDQDVIITGKTDLGIEVADLFLNDGSGNYSISVSSNFIGVFKSAIDFSDIDNDGDQDVLISGDDGSFGDSYSTTLYINNGLGVFTSSFNSPAFYNVYNGEILFADIDGDNDEDLVISGESEFGKRIDLYKNVNGNFQLISDVPNCGHYWNSTTFDFADIDSDSDLDLLVRYTSFPNNCGEQDELYINDGLGNFQLDLGTQFSYLYGGTVGFFDFDGDNDQDIFHTGSNGNPTTYLYENLCPYVYDTTVIDSACLYSSYTFPDGEIFNVSSDTSYVSYLSSIEGCDSAVTVNLYLLPSTYQSVISVTDQTICFNDSIALSYTGSFDDVNWSASRPVTILGVTGGEILTGEYIKIISGVTSFYFSGMANSGCVFDSITVEKVSNSYAYPIINGSPPDVWATYFCDDSPVQVTLQANHNSPEGWGNINWSNGVQEGVPFYIQQGQSTFSFTTSHPFGCLDSASVTLSVNPAPNVVATATPSNNVCDGNQVSLVGEGSSAGVDPFGNSSEPEYSWTGPGGMMDFYDDNTPFLPLTEGYYTVQSTDSNNCHGIDSIYISFVEPEVGQISSFLKDPVCLKDNTMPLPNATPSGGTYYGIGIAAGSSTFNPDWAGLGMHTIVYEFTDGNGCEGQASKDIEVIESPEFSFQTNNNSVELSSTMSCLNYYWDFGDGNTNSLTLNPAYTYANPGIYSICLICDDLVNCANCMNISFPSNISGIVNGTIGIEETIESDNFSIYPNPNQGKFTLIYDAKIGGADVMLYSISGQLLKKYKLSETENSIQVDIAAYQNGMYIVSIKTEDEVIVKRIIKN